MTENREKGRPLFYFRLQRSSRARWIVQGRGPLWFAEKIILAWGWEKGYTLKERRDKKDVLRGYTVGIGDIIYKALELGKDRTLMASKIETTWNRLHNRSATELKQEGNKISVQTATRSDADLKTIGDRPVADYFSWHDGTSKYELTHDGRDYNLLQKLVSQTDVFAPPDSTCMIYSKTMCRSVFRKRTGKCCRII